MSMIDEEWPAAQSVATPHGGVPATSAELTPHRAAEGPAIEGGGGPVTMHDGGGPELTSAHISLIYWGTAWTNSATTPTSAQFTSALQDIVNGPWATQLNQYHGIGRAVVDHVVTYTSSNPPAGFVESDIHNFVDARINDGTLAAPADADQRLYAVLLPTGHSSTDTSFVGQHQNYARSDGKTVYYAWVTNDGSLTGGNSIPKVFSHEVSEALTDPKVSTGPTGITCNSGDEIGDVCNDVYSTVNGHAVQAYWSGADNRAVLPVFTDLPGVRGNPGFIQGRFGGKGNFEVVTPAASGGLFHAWRNNDNSFMPWAGPFGFGGSVGQVDGAVLIESNYGTPGNLEVIVNAGGHLQAFWRECAPNFTWHGPYPIAPSLQVRGNATLIQSRFGNKGNFELVVPVAGGGLAHLWRNNDDPAMPWMGPYPFGGSVGAVDGATLIESNYGTPGNLEVIVNAGGHLQAFWRECAPNYTWHGPYLLLATTW
jgi:hypothetical protein